MMIGKYIVVVLKKGFNERALRVDSRVVAADVITELGEQIVELGTMGFSKFQNDNEVAYPAFKGTSVQIGGVAILEEDGSVLFYSELTYQPTLFSGDTFLFKEGSIEISIT